MRQLFKQLFTPLPGKLTHVKFHGNKTAIHQDRIPLPKIRQWTSITVSHTKTGFLTIMFGGLWEKTYTVERSDTHILKNVKVYASNPVNTATPGYMCGFTIKAGQ